MWNWREENDVDVDKNDTVTVPATERDLEERERLEQSNRQQQYVVGFLSLFLLSCRH